MPKFVQIGTGRYNIEHIGCYDRKHYNTTHGIVTVIWIYNKDLTNYVTESFNSVEELDQEIKKLDNALMYCSSSNKCF